MNILLLDIKFNQLERDILADIAYIYHILLSKDDGEDMLTVFKSRISPFNKKFITFGGLHLKKLSESGFITPYNTLEAMITDRITETFSDIRLPEQIQMQLFPYGKRGDVIHRQFQENKDGFIQSTINKIIRAVHNSIMQEEDFPYLFSDIHFFLLERKKELHNLFSALSRQLKRYMILWKYQDDGYQTYRFMTKDENCETCSSLNKKVFSISDAKAGTNFILIHPNCDCYIEILDHNENVRATLSDEHIAMLEEGDISQKSLGDTEANWYDGFLRIPSDAVELFKNFNLAQQQRLNDFKNPLSFLDWFTLGYVSALESRSQLMLGEPGIYNFGNWATLGLLDTIKGTIRPEELFSLQHWLDSFGVAATTATAYGAVKSNAAGQGKSMPSKRTGRALEYLDDSADDATKATVEGTGSKIKWDSWQNYEKVTANGQEYAKVGERLYSKHAVDRMQPSGNRFGPNIYQAGGDYGRSVAPQFVEDVISSVKPTLQPNGNLSYVSGTVEIITNQQGAVVTIMTYR